MASVACSASRIPAFTSLSVSQSSGFPPTKSASCYPLSSLSRKPFQAISKRQVLVHAHSTPSAKQLGTGLKGLHIGRGSVSLRGEGFEALQSTVGQCRAKVNMITWNKELLISLAVPLGGGFLVSAIAAPKLKLYWEMKKPKWAPPAPLFGNVWSIIYLLIGYSAWLVYRDSGGFAAQPGLWKLYGAQLILNWLWQPLFFNKQLLGVAFIDLVLLWGTIVALISKFSAINVLAGKALVPYLLWVTFAGFLNLNLWQNNPAKDKDPKQLQPKAA